MAKPSGKSHNPSAKTEGSGNDGGPMSSLLPFALPWHDWYFPEWITPGAKVLNEMEGFTLAAREQIEPTQSISMEDEALVFRRLHEANNALSFLVKLAKQGHAGAAGGLVSLVAKECAELSALSATNPSLLRPIAHKCFKWPVMKSRNPIFSDSDAILTNLQLGKELPVEMDASARGKLDEAGTIAWHLLCHVWQVRKIAPKYYDSSLRDEINALDKFNDDSKPEWWAVARKCFLFSYPKPQRILELDEMVTAISHRRSAGRIRRSILELIKARFFSFAPAMN